MQNNIQVFENQEFGKVRVINIDGQPWWVLRDVCEVLGISNSRMVADRLDADEKKVLKSQSGLPLNIPNRGLSVISESGLYAVIIRSDKPNAKGFRKWITAEVLPSIRKHGAYITNETLEKMRESEEFTEALLKHLALEKIKSDTLAAFANQAIPKIRYHDIVLQCPEAVQVSIIAKDYGMSAVSFNKLLYRLDVQYRMGKTWLLYSKHTGNGYTVTKTYEVNGRLASIHMCWTQRGRYWLYTLLKGYGILPEAEKLAAS
jgi:prophage antirepressor-like protein